MNPILFFTIFCMLYGQLEYLRAFLRRRIINQATLN